jgi:hypothetical protein
MASKRFFCTDEYKQIAKYSPLKPCIFPKSEVDFKLVGEQLRTLKKYHEMAWNDENDSLRKKNCQNGFRLVFVDEGRTKTHKDTGQLSLSR